MFLFAWSRIQAPTVMRDNEPSGMDIEAETKAGKFEGHIVLANSKPEQLVGLARKRISCKQKHYNSSYEGRLSFRYNFFTKLLVY